MLPTPGGVKESDHDRINPQSLPLDNNFRHGWLVERQSGLPRSAIHNDLDRKVGGSEDRQRLQTYLRGLPHSLIMIEGRVIKKLSQ